MTPTPRLVPDRPSVSIPLAALVQIIGSMRNFADVADHCTVTEVVNGPPSIRTWADMLAELIDAAAPPAEAPAERGDVDVLSPNYEAGFHAGMRFEASNRLLAAAPAGEVVTVCCGRRECGGECGNEWQGTEAAWSGRAPPAGTKLYTAAPAAPAEGGKDALHKMNGALCAFGMRWKLDGDYLRCRSCNRPIIASHADAFRHADDCTARDSAEPHPWRTLVRLLQPITPRVTGGREDSARLDWLLSKAARDFRVQGSDANGWAVLDCSNGLTFLVQHAETSRAAIDAAIALQAANGGAPA